MMGVRRAGTTTSSTTAMIHCWLGSGGDTNLSWTGPRPPEVGGWGQELLTGLWDELAGDAVARPHRAAVEEVLGLNAVTLALLQPLDGH